MSMMSIGTLICFSICLVPITGYKYNYTGHVFEALERVLRYMKENDQYMNIDSAFGVTVSVANLQDMLSDGLKSEVCQKYQLKLNLLLNTANETLNGLLPYVSKGAKNTLFLQTILDPKAWRKSIQFGKRLNKSYFYRKFRKIKTPTKYLLYVQTPELEEDDIDACLVALVAQQPTCCKKHICTISPDCLELLVTNSSNMRPAYGATHSLLLLQVARSQQCILKQVNIEAKIKEYCAYISWEANSNYRFGFIDELGDLFLEQVLLCGYEGFIDYLSDSYIEYILGLQDDSGCFKMDLESQEVVKRDINLLNDGCADHTTGLGAGALSIILRYLLSC